MAFKRVHTSQFFLFWWSWNITFFFNGLSNSLFALPSLTKWTKVLVSLRLLLLTSRVQHSRNQEMKWTLPVHVVCMCVYVPQQVCVGLALYLSTIAINCIILCMWLEQSTPYHTHHHYWSYFSLHNILFCKTYSQTGEGCLQCSVKLLSSVAQQYEGHLFSRSLK